MPERRAMPEIFGVDGPRTASVCQNEVVANLRRREPSVEQIIRIGLDTSNMCFSCMV